MVDKKLKMLRGYAFCVVSAVPLALLWVAAGYGVSGPVEQSAAEMLAGTVAVLLVAVLLTSVSGLVFGLPIVAGLSRIGMANAITLTLAGALAGLFIYYVWMIAPAASDPHVAESIWQLITETRGMLLGFMASGAFSANAFWFGAK